MCKGLRITTLTVMMILLVMTMVPVVYAKGNPQTSSFDGITVSTAADVVEGQFTLTGTNESGKKLKIWIRKDNNAGRFYDVANREEINETITLVDGAGSYNIFVMIQVSGNTYSYGPYLTVNNVKAEQVVEGESKDIDSENEEIVELSKKLTQGKKTSSEKVEAIYSWIVENITYDYQKYNHILMKDFSDKYGSVVTLETQKGVCYDYSTLFAALCRASGVEARVAKGYSTNIVGYHAWNEVYDAEKKQWMTLDTTVDSVKYHKTGKKSRLNIRSDEEYYKTEEM